MKARQSVLLDTARHVQAFLDEHASTIGSTITSSCSQRRAAMTTFPSSCTFDFEGAEP